MCKLIPLEPQPVGFSNIDSTAGTEESRDQWNLETTSAARSNIFLGGFITQDLHGLHPSQTLAQNLAANGSHDLIRQSSQIPHTDPSSLHMSQAEERRPGMPPEENLASGSGNSSRKMLLRPCEKDSRLDSLGANQLGRTSSQILQRSTEMKRSKTPKSKGSPASQECTIVVSQEINHLAAISFQKRGPGRPKGSFNKQKTEHSLKKSLTSQQSARNKLEQTVLQVPWVRRALKGISQ
jgi:hypothetical protein